MKRKPKSVPMAIVTITWTLPLRDAKGLRNLYRRQARKEEKCRAKNI